MSFGSSTPTPKPQPVTPVPQEDDPKALEERKTVARLAAAQEGATAHLLNGPKGITEEPLADIKKLQTFG